MYDFIKGIYDFVRSISQTISQYHVQVGGGTTSSTAYLNYAEFMQSNILNGTLISSPLTWQQLLLYVVPLVLLFLSIYLFVKLAFKLLSLFSLR